MKFKLFSPRSVYHAFADKSVRIEHSTIVAVSYPGKIYPVVWNSNIPTKYVFIEGYCPTVTANTHFVRNSRQARGILRDRATRLARTGLLWPSFISTDNNAPRSPFVLSTSYPAIGGRTELHGMNDFFLVGFRNRLRRNICCYDRSCFREFWWHDVHSRQYSDYDEFGSGGLSASDLHIWTCIHQLVWRP